MAKTGRGNRFPKKARLNQSAEFHRVYRKGWCIKVFPLRIYVLRRDGRGSRLGLSISSKVGPATVRNKWKRKIREAFRLHRNRLDGTYDFVVSVSWNSSRKDIKKVEEAFCRALDAIEVSESTDSKS
jgi:ribonuclease P protein component